LILAILDSDCERSGMAVKCVSYGVDQRTETTYNLLVLTAGGFFGTVAVLRVVVGAITKLRSPRRDEG
jgi:hypothetical protein